MSLDLTSAATGTVDSIDQLEALLGTPKPTSIAKESVGMTALEQEFVRMSPFHLLATSSPDGACDVSPRGDPPGSVWVACDRTLILPDRPGNRRADSLRNIVANPHVGLLFVVPGCDETLRINGRAHLTTHETILERLVVEGKRPGLAIVVHTEQVYMHCARAFLRSKLWKLESWPDRASVPQMPAIFKEKLCLDGSVKEIAAERAGRYQSDPLF